jgi:DNA repair protein RadA/Sms
MTASEPAADLAVLAAVASSFRNRAVPPDVVVFGEVGLAGEVRSTPHAALRLREAAQLGFKRCVLPEANLPARDMPPTIEPIGIRTAAAALDVLLG